MELIVLIFFFMLNELYDLHFRIPLKLFYMCQCGFYTYSIAALVTWETRRKDFSVMMSHHVVTVILISYSYVTRYLFNLWMYFVCLFMLRV